MKACARARRTAPALEALAGVAIAGVVAFAYWRIASGISTVGDFMGFITALLLAAQPIRSLGTVTTATLEGLAAADRIYELLDEKPTVVDRPGARPLAVAQGTIVFDNVSFGYATAAGTLGGQQLLAHRARAARRRRWSAARAAGKSTVINLVRAAVRRRRRPHPASTGRTCAR